MALPKKKRQTGRPIASGVVPRDRPGVKHGPNSISDEQAHNFRKFLNRWIEENCDGEGQRSIAARLGVTQNEISAWMNDKARPGIARLIHIHRVTGETIEDILGVK